MRRFISSLTFDEIAYKSNECHHGFIGDVFEFGILGQQAGYGPDGIYIFAERIRDVLVEFCAKNYNKREFSICCWFAYF